MSFKTESPCPDDESLALYLDGGASAADREQVEAHLTRCAACRAIVVDASSVAREAVTPSGVANEPAPPRSGRLLPFPRLRWQTVAAAALAAAAVMAFAVRTDWMVRRPPLPTSSSVAAGSLGGWGGAPGPTSIQEVPPAAVAVDRGRDNLEDSPVAQEPRKPAVSRNRVRAPKGTVTLKDARGLLSDARIGVDINNPALDGLRSAAEWRNFVGAATNQPIRPVYGRLVLFDYSPPPSASSSVAREVSPALRETAEALKTFTDQAAGAEYRAASGVASLVTGDVDRAVAMLEAAIARQPDSAAAQNDLAVAYIERGATRSQAADFQRALSATDRAIELAPLLRAPSFNRALALEHLHLDSEAGTAWADVAHRDAGSPWAAEADARAKALASTR